MCKTIKTISSILKHKFILESVVRWRVPYMTSLAKGLLQQVFLKYFFVLHSLFQYLCLKWPLAYWRKSEFSDFRASILEIGAYIDNIIDRVEANINIYEDWGRLRSIVSAVICKFCCVNKLLSRFIRSMILTILVLSQYNTPLLLVHVISTYCQYPLPVPVLRPEFLLPKICITVSLSLNSSLKLMFFFFNFERVPLPN